MSKAIPKECMALLKEASEMFSETGCVHGVMDNSAGPFVSWDKMECKDAASSHLTAVKTLSNI